ncbi:uncharacterized protein EV420DRAFT_1473530 [Desarmillaria tabescens]|uniref:Uncharacterized protein n=1 Tax=Armillaria tabescens TaxID=1929756 RepID=A0AA39TYZ6_ARMTA|nr:uncharacterized protein EV420DRAFT_1473530 [Desarmillaria tabescens]KAK0470473.1 hypothetical protein EV420DRAFT_1473530 [Desarmillaria tabescens]
MDHALHHALQLANLASDQKNSVDIVFSYDINSHELTKDILYAWKQLTQHESYFHHLVASLPAEQVQSWEKLPRELPVQGSRTGADKGYVSPYWHHKQKVSSMDGTIETLLLNPCKLVAIGANSDEAAEFISESINLEQQQHHLQMLIEKEKAYPNKTDQEMIKHKRTSLEKSIRHWFELRLKFMGIASKFSLPAENDSEEIPTKLTKKKKKKKFTPSNAEAWPLVADQLQALGYDKSKNIHGYKPNTKAQEKLCQVKFQQNLGIADWNAHQNALLVMGTMDNVNTQMKGLSRLKKEDTARKSVDEYCHPDTSRIVDGMAYTWFWKASIQSSAKGLALQGMHKHI